jgi:hypothetical protein
MARKPESGEKVDVLDVVKTHRIAATTSAKKTAAGVGADTVFVTIISGAGGYLRRGTSSVEAAVPDADASSTSDVYFPGGEIPFDLPVTPGQYVSVILASGTGTTIIMERR